MEVVNDCDTPISEERDIDSETLLDQIYLTPTTTRTIATRHIGEDSMSEDWTMRFQDGSLFVGV